MVANQTTAEVTVEIYDDGIPETDETFLVNISNPVGGATLGEQRSILVTILSNDDAHGRIGFKEVCTCTCTCVCMAVKLFDISYQW